MSGQTVAVRKALARTDGVEFKPAGLVIPDGFEFQQWEDIGRTIKVMNDGVQWWLGDWLNFGERKYGEKYSQALNDTEYQAFQDVAWVARQFEISRRRENLTWSHHREAAPLEIEEQNKVLDAASAGKLSTRELRRLIAEHKQLSLKSPVFPPDTYRVIYADPPWKYNDERMGTGAAAHYPLMELEAICQLVDPAGRSVRDVSRSDSVCFLWVTSPLLPDGLHVLDAWGFEYKASFVWDKVRGYNGHYNDVRHEVLLVGTRGSCLPDAKELADSVVTAEKARHSAKPDVFYELIEGLYQNGPYLELFARRKRDGWSVWGNQAQAA